MTSEKMNPLMLQRYDASIRLPQSPRSDSAIASPNQRQSTHAKAARLRLNTMGAHVWPLIQPASENITPSNASAARAGCHDIEGTWESVVCWGTFFQVLSGVPHRRTSTARLW